MANRIDFQIGYTVDKAGLSEMQSLFQRIANLAKQPGKEFETGLQQAAATATTLDEILEKTFNTNLGTLNVVKFNQELNKAGMTLKSVQTDLSKAGNQGSIAYNRLSQAILGTNLELKESNKLLDSMATTMANTVKWGITSSIFNTITNSIQKAYSYSKQLNTSLNDIRIVTDKSADSMERFAEQANEAAKGMGASTLDYTNAALIYYQQGLSDAEVQARAETTIKAANVTGQAGEEVSEQLTAVWNGYKVSAEETEAYVDKLAAVAATTAADLEELSIGMSKVAAAANAMGVDFDDLNAQIATIVSVTRQAPESVGTALKTIYARLGDLKVDGVDEFGVKLGEVSSQMETMGIQILNQNGDLRDMSSVIAEVAQKWNGWTEAQKQAAAVAMAGKRQYNNLIALFDNWGMYTDALNTSAEAMGTLQHQQDIYMESTVAKLKTLKATWQDLYEGLLDDDELNTGIEALTNLVQVFDNFIDSFGGGIKSIMAFGAVISSIFNKQISNAINEANHRQLQYKQNLDAITAKQYVISSGRPEVSTGSSVRDQSIVKGTQAEYDIAQKLLEVRKGLTTEEYNELTSIQQKIGTLAEEQEYIKLSTIEAATQNLKGEEKVEIEKKYLKYFSMETEEFETLKDKQLDIINKAIEKISIEEKIQEILKKESRTYGEIEEYQKRIDAAVKNKTEEEQKAIKILLKEEINAKDILEYNEKILQISNQKIENENNNLKEAEKEINTLEKIYEKRKNIAESKEKELNLQQEINRGLEKAKNSQNIAQDVTQITSALGSMAMAWSSVNSLMQTWNDESISFGDKITQSLITLGFTLPMVMSNLSKLNDLFRTSEQEMAILTVKQDAYNASQIRNNALTEYNNTIKGISEGLRKKEIIETSELVTTEQLEAITTGEQTAEQIALNLNESIGNTLTEEEIAILIKLIGVKAAATGATKAQIAAEAELQALQKMNPYLLIGAAIIAIISGIVKVIDNQRKKQKELAEENLKEIKLIEEQADANEELLKTFDESFAKYKELKSNQEDVNLISEDLRETTLKLAEAYDIAGASLLAMGGYYDILNGKIKEAREKELDEIINKSKKGAEEVAFLAASEASEGWFDSSTLYNDKYHFSSSSQAISDSGSGERLKNVVSALGLDKYFSSSMGYDSLEYTFSIGFDITNPEDVKEKLTDINNLIDFYQSKYDKQTLKYDYHYNQFLEEQKQFKERYEELSNQLSIGYNAEIEKALNNIDFSNLSFEEIYKKIDIVKKELVEKNIIPIDEIDQVTKNAIKNIVELQDVVDKLDLAERISKETNQTTEEVLKIIENFNDSDLAVLEVGLDTGLLDKDLQKWIDTYSPILVSSELTTTGEKIKNALSNYDEKKGFKEDDLKSVFNQSNIEDVMGMSISQFNFSDEGDKLGVLTNAWIQNNKNIIEGREEINKKLEEEKIKLEEERKNIEDDATFYEKKFVDIISDIDDFDGKIEEVKQALKDLYENGWDSLDTSTKALVIDFEEKTGVSRNASETFGQWFSQVDSLENRYNGLTSLQNTINSLTEDHAKNIEFLNEVEKIHNNILDEVQSSYQSLSSIIDDYNETGAWTLDNVQKLISMDDRYIAALDFENGQLVMNEKSFQEMTLAKIDDLEQTIILEMQEKLLALAQQHAADTALANAKEQDFQATKVREGIEAAKKGALAWDAFAKAQAEAAGVSDAKYKKDVDEITKSTQNQILALENVRNSIKKGGTDFKRAMGDGKSKKDSKDKELKDLEEEFDRYWDIKKAIDAIDHAIKRLDKDQENLFGYELINSLKQENKLLEQQKINYEKLLAAQHKEAEELRTQLSLKGVLFDASGAIVNYAKVTSEALATYNDAIQKYNAGLIDETTFNTYEKSFENFKKLLDRYDKLYYTEIEETKDKLDDIRREQLANNLKGWEVEVELKLNLKELKRGWNDFLSEINKNFKKVYQDLRVEVKRLQEDARTYVGNDGSIATTINAIHDVTAEIDKMRAGGSSNMFESISQAQEKLKELNDKLQDNARGLHDLWEDAWKAYIDGIDEAADKFDDLMEQFERMNDELEFQGELIELLYGEEAYALMDKLYKGQERSLGNQIQSLKQQVDMWEQLWRDSGATMDNQSDWTEDQKKYYEQWTKAQGELNDLVIDYIKLLKDDYLNTVNQVLSELEKALTGSSLKDMKTDWERISAYSDKYLDDVEQAYEAQKLANKIDESIASTDNLKNQQKLQALRDKEIKYLREKEHLTQYDLDAAEARYQIALKEIALEDARNNKTSMKLVRNEQGNWSYQYLADEEDVISKQQELLEAYGNLYQLASDAYEANLEALQNLQEKYLESAKEIYLNETLSEEEKEQKLLELRNWYFEQYALLAEENTLYRNDLATSAAALLLEIYNQDQEAYTSMTEAERALVDALVEANIEDYMDLEDKIKENFQNIGDKSKELMADTRIDWQSTAQDLADFWNKDAGGSVRYEVEDAYNRIQIATENYKNKVDWLAAAVDRDFGEMGITGAIDKASEATDRLRDKTEELVYDSINYLSDLRGTVDDVERAWRSVEDAIKDAIQQIEEYLRYLGDVRAEQAAVAASSGGAWSEPGGGDSGGDDSGDHRTEPFTPGSNFGVNVKHGWRVYNAFDKGGIPVHDQYFDDYKKAVRFRQSLYDAGGRADLEYYDTGGYTGSWENQDGKVAILHQKELVLNKEDTSNFLSGISILRDMTSANGSIGNAIMRAVSNMVSALNNTKINGIERTTINETNETGGNTFNIYADFPNANDVNDIREALISLPNLASQFIARNYK